MNAWLYLWETLQKYQIANIANSSQQDCWLLLTISIENLSNIPKFKASLVGIANQPNAVEANTAEEIEQFINQYYQRNPLTGVIFVWSREENFDYQHGYNKFIAFAFLLKFFLQNYPQLPLYICTQACQNVIAKTNLNELNELFGYALANICKCIWLEHPQYPLFYLDDQQVVTNDALLEIIKKAPFNISPLLAYSNDNFYQPILKQYQLPKEIDASSLKISEQAVYIVVGGTGGIGRQVVYELIKQGAGRVIVLSRRAESNTSKINQPQIDYYTLDVTDSCAVSKFFEGLTSSGTPLKGIFYAAGHLNDKSFITMEKDDFDAVWQVKSYGAWLFHYYSLPFQLDRFVLFSSISSSLGQAMQTNYSAANGFLDALSHLRRNKQLASQSMQWSPWQETGMTELNEHIHAYAKARGVELITSEGGMMAFYGALIDDSPLLQIGDINWPLFIKTSPNKRWPACLYKSLDPAHSHATTSIPKLKDLLEYQVIGTTNSYYSALSFQQLEIWGYLLQTTDSTPYHVFIGLQTKKALELQKIKKAIEILVSTHELLRASFHTINDQPMLKINHAIRGHIDVIEINDEDPMEIMLQQFQANYQLDTPPLFRVCYLFNERLNNFILCFVIHHLICDGYSVIKILIDQFIKLYDQQAITKTKQQYSDYIAWQWQYYKSEKYFASLRFWQKVIKPWYKNNKTILPTPVGGIVKTTLDENVIKVVNNYARKNKTAPYYFILASLIKVLAEFFNSNIIGIVIFFSGRDENFSTVFGDTSNDAIISVEDCQAKSIEQMTQEIGDVIETAKKNQYVRLDQLAAAGSEIPKISFDYQVVDNISLMLDEAEANIIGIKTKQIPLWGNDPRHLSFKFYQYKTSLDFSLKYRADVYTRQEASEMINKIVKNFTE